MRRLAVVAVLALLPVACGDGGGEQLDPALARLALVEDVVDVRPADIVAYDPGVPGQGLGAGDDVRTGQPGFAEVAYRDGSLTRLDAETEFRVVDLSSEEAGAVVDATLDRGRVWNRVRDLEAEGRFAVDSAVGTAAVRGTAFDVDCRDAEGRGCVFTLVEGALAVANEDGDIVDLADLQRVTVAPDGVIGEVEQLTLGQVLGDGWLARNLREDARRGFPVLAEAAPAEPDGVPVVVTEPPGFDDGAARVRSAEVRTAGDDTVTQTVVVGGPRTIRLAWRFCNPQVCGTSDNIVCVAGYSPRYLGQLVQDITIPAPEGHELVAATFAVGETPADTVAVGRLGDGFVGAAASFAVAPERTDAGGVRFSLAQAGLESTIRRVEGFPDRACSISEARRDEIVAQYGNEVDVEAAVVEVTLTWRVVDPPEGPVRQEILAGTSSIGTAVFAPMTTPARVVDDAPVFTTTDDRWGGDEVPGAPATDGDATPTFADIGTVPTAIANALVRVGVDVTPSDVGDALLATGAWRPGVGVDLTALRADDGTLDLGRLIGEAAVGVVARPAAVASTLRALAAGEVVALAALADREHRTVVTLIGYDQTTDTVTLLHPHDGATSVALDALLGVLASLDVIRPVADEPAS